MAGQILREKVRSVAKQVVDINEPYYPEELIDLLPDELLDVEPDDDNLSETAIAIDKIRFWKQCELMSLLGMLSAPFDSESDDSTQEELNDVINNEARFDELSSEQQVKVKEMKFLSNVALTVLHQ